MLRRVWVGVTICSTWLLASVVVALSRAPVASVWVICVVAAGTPPETVAAVLVVETSASCAS